MAQTPEEKAAAKAAKDAEKAAAKADAASASASVYAKTGGLMRVYDLETHGKDFADLAQEFSDHNEGSTVQLA